MCVVDAGTYMSRTPVPQTHGNESEIQRGDNQQWQCLTGECKH